ncbi:MAG: hypothetical protein Kow00114_00910 [Kiloniellaceae bacterium]
MAMSTLGPRSQRAGAAACRSTGWQGSVPRMASVTPAPPLQAATPSDSAAAQESLRHSDPLRAGTPAADGRALGIDMGCLP